MGNRQTQKSGVFHFRRLARSYQSDRWMSDNKSRCVFLLLLSIFRSRTRTKGGMEEKETMDGLDGWRVCYTIINGEDVNLVGEGFSIAREFFDRYL